MKRTPLRPGHALARKTPLRKRNPARKRSAFARQYHSDLFVAFTHASPSSASGNMGCICSHSAKSRGAGGTYKDVVPLSREEHAEEHRMGVRAFWAMHGKSPRKEARLHWQRFLAYQQSV